MSWNVFFQFFPGGWTFNVGCSRVQHGGDTSSPLLDRVREQTHTHNVPKGRDPQVQFLVDPRVDRVPVQPSRRMRLHAVLQEAEEGQGAHRGDRDGRWADHHRPLIFFFFFFFLINYVKRLSCRTIINRERNNFVIEWNVWFKKTRVAIVSKPRSINFRWSKLVVKKKRKIERKGTREMTRAFWANEELSIVVHLNVRMV